MNIRAFFYGVGLQMRLDIRSRTLLVTCYLVPLLFFALMGGIFTSLMPETKATLTQAMTVMGVSMGALIGVPPSLAEVYGTDIKKAYRANGAPLWFGAATVFLSAFFHLFVMSCILLVLSPVLFDAAVPQNLPAYFLSLAVFLLASLSLGTAVGLSVGNQAKLTMISQIFFLPSILLSGILFPISYLPKALEILGWLFPASWGYKLMLDGGLRLSSFLPLCALFAAACAVCILRLHRLKAES